jgi:hypothetical protein
MKTLIATLWILSLSTGQVRAAQANDEISNLPAVGAQYPTLGAVEVGDASDTMGEEVGVGSRRRHPDLSYFPVEPTAPLALREANWRDLRIKDVVQDGRILRRDVWLSTVQARRYYRNAHSPESRLLEEKGVSKRVKSALWTWIPAPVAGTVLAFVGGCIADAQYNTAVNGEYNNSYTLVEQKEAQDAVVGAAIGVGLGLALGLPLANASRREADTDFHEAAEQFNRKLLQDLHLQVRPTQGGAKVGISMDF